MHGEGAPLAQLLLRADCRIPGNQLLRSQQPATKLDNENLGFPALFILR